jgi:hypothetical protein
MFPLLDLHMRDADCVGALPPAGCVLVAHSEHEGGIGGTEGGCTVRKFTTAFSNYDAASSGRLAYASNRSPEWIPEKHNSSCCKKLRGTWLWGCPILGGAAFPALR